MMNTTTVQDLVCGMSIDMSSAAGQTEYKGQSYYFCGVSCKQKFDVKPELYLAKSAAATAE